MAILFAQFTSVSENSTLSDLLVYQLTGLMIVLIVLCSLWMTVSIFGKVFKYLDLKDPVVESAFKQAASSENFSDSSQAPFKVTPEIQAVIGAALHTVIKGPFKIVSVEESEKQSKS